MNELKFVSNNGATIFIKRTGRIFYQMRFSTSKLWFSNLKRFDCFLFASHKMKKSMKSLDWTQEK